MQFLYFMRKNSSTATAEYFYVAAPGFVQQVFHVFEKLNVAALVGGNGYTVHVFFYGTFHDFVNTAIMAQMNDFRAFDCMMRRMILMAAS